MLRAGHRHGWGRYTPLPCGVFVFAAVLPAQALQPSAFLWSVAGWSVCFILFGTALYRHASSEGTR